MKEKELNIQLKESKELNTELEKLCELRAEYIAADNLAAKASMFISKEELCLA